MKNNSKSWRTDDIYEVFKKSIPISTGSTNFDAILDGGFYPGIAYIVYGEFNTGKTQLCMQLCTSGYKTLFIDSENTFRPERIKQISSNLNLKPERILNSIDHSKIMSVNALYVLIDKLDRIIEENNYKLILIDSITNHFRVEQFTDKKNAFFLKTQFMKVLKTLNSITKKHNLITVITSQVSSTFSDESFFPVKPFALTLLNHFFSEFLYLSLIEENKRAAHIVNSGFLPERRSLFTITEKGIRDYTLIPKT